MQNLKEAGELEFIDYLRKELDLTPYQHSRLYKDEIIRVAKYRIFKEVPKVKTSPFWRITILLIPVYWLLVVVFCLLKWLVTGSRYLPEPFIKKIHRPWMHKLNIDL